MAYSPSASAHANGIGQRFVVGQTLGGAVEGGFAQSQLVDPIINEFPLALKDNPAIPSGVSRLLLVSSPFHVAGFVTEFIFKALNRIEWRWALSYVLQESRK